MTGPDAAGSAPAIAIVTSADRPDLDDQARAAFRPGWPEFIFHDQLVHEYIARVGDYFPRYDILVLDGGEVVAGGWGVPLQWDGAIAALPEGYDGGLARAVTGHEQSVRPDSLAIMAAAVKPGRRGARPGRAGADRAS